MVALRQREEVPVWSTAQWIWNQSEDYQGAPAMTYSKSPTPWLTVQDGDYIKVLDADGTVVSDLRLAHPYGWGNALLIANAPRMADVLARLVAESLGTGPRDITVREAM